MLKREMPVDAEKKLELGDYVTVHLPGLNRHQGDNASERVVQLDREAFFQRAQKQRRELIEMQQDREAFIQQAQKQRGKLIDVRNRSAA
jgi:hypothetical protein